MASITFALACIKRASPHVLHSNTVERICAQAFKGRIAERPAVKKAMKAEGLGK